MAKDYEGGDRTLFKGYQDFRLSELMDRQRDLSRKSPFAIPVLDPI
jgi:hypothetical protein